MTKRINLYKNLDNIDKIVLFLNLEVNYLEECEKLKCKFFTISLIIPQFCSLFYIFQYLGSVHTSVYPYRKALIVNLYIIEFSYKYQPLHDDFCSRYDLCRRKRSNLVTRKSVQQYLKIYKKNINFQDFKVFYYRKKISIIKS